MSPIQQTLVIIGIGTMLIQGCSASSGTSQEHDDGVPMDSSSSNDSSVDSNVSDVSVVSDAPGRSDASGGSDASDVSDAPDSPDVSDTSGVSDASGGPDASDVSDVSDVQERNAVERSGRDRDILEVTEIDACEREPAQILPVTTDSINICRFSGIVMGPEHTGIRP